LSPQGIRQVKREIRVLGVAARRDPVGFFVVGVVYRGGLWLDGVIRNRSAGTLSEAIEGMLAGSPHLGQVRVILLSRTNLPADEEISIEELSTRTGRPVIMLGEGGYSFKSGAEKTPYSVAGVSHWSAEAILKTTTREELNPEALRVAELTISALHAERDA
jgi:endonuclease V-like protein UPF0215 family